MKHAQHILERRVIVNIACQKNAHQQISMLINQAIVALAQQIIFLTQPTNHASQRLAHTELLVTTATVREKCILEMVANALIAKTLLELNNLTQDVTLIHVKAIRLLS